MFQIDITDHYLAFCNIICDSILLFQSKQNLYNKDYKKTELVAYRKEILTVVACTLDFMSLISQFTLNIIFDNFSNQFKMVIDKYALLEKALSKKQKILRLDLGSLKESIYQ